MLEEWPLIGRDQELDLIASLGQGPDGPAGVILAGAAGVGKTRLAREALSAAADRGAVTRWVSATASARALPLGAFTALVGAPGTDPTQLIERTVEALLAGCGPGRLVLGVDDAHLLDDLSAVVVHQLVMRRAASVVLTVRVGEPAPDAVTASWKDGPLRMMEVRPLTRTETSALLEAALGGPLDSTAARRLWSISQGNSLYLYQVVLGEREAGRLSETAGMWRWSGTPRLSVGLTELVRARMGALTDAQRDVVELLAFGEPLGAALLTRLTEAGAVEQAEALGVVEATLDGRRLEVRLAHPLYGEVQRAQCGQLRASRIRGRLATALATPGGRRAGDTLRRAVLAVESDLPHDAALLTAGAQEAFHLAGLPLAARLAGAAVAVGGGFEARLVLASTLVWLTTAAEGELAALYECARTDEQRRQATVLWVTYLFWRVARPDEADRVLRVAQTDVTQVTAARELAALRTVIDAFLGHGHDAADSAKVLLDDPRLAERARALASFGLVVASTALGRIDGVRPVLQRGVAAADGKPDLGWTRLAQYTWYALGLCLAGDLAEATEILQHAHSRWGERAYDSDVINVVVGAEQVARGRPVTALRHLREARGGLAAAGTDGGWLYGCRLYMTIATAMSGDAAEARRCLVELEHNLHPGVVVVEPERLLAHAWVAASEGIVREALGYCREAATLAAAAGQSAHEMVALHTAVCFGDRTCADRLAELADQVDGPRAPAAYAHAAALAARDGDALLAASSQLEAMGAMLLAADAAAQAADAHERRGDRGPARVAATRARELAEQCEHARTPAMRDLAQPLPLSRREREIVTLAAGGLSNLDIARRLTISVRTVEGHLYRSFTKLGISDRADLPRHIG